LKVSLTYPTPIWSDNFPNINNDELSEFILEEQKSGEGMTLHELDGWRTASQDMFENDKFKLLLSQVEERLKVVCGQLEINPKYELGKGVGWAYITTKGGWHPPHCHPDGYLSCVYYIDVPQDSNSQLVFDDPRQQTSMCPIDTYMNVNTLNHARIPINPKSGDFYVFPSWLKHFVSPSMSEENRIMITLNYPLVEK
jgi:uncharacterized protein (TIGR02466 family)